MRAGLLLRKLREVAIIGKPYYWQYIHHMVTYFKALSNSNPRCCRVSESATSGVAVVVSGFRLGSTCTPKYVE